VGFADRNGDDPYEWSTDWLILRLPESFVVQKESAWRQGRGNSGRDHNGRAQQPHRDRFDSPALANAGSVFIVLMGWEFELVEDDMHLTGIGIRIRDVQLDRENESVSWEVQSVFSDETGDDPYNWRYRYAVVVLPHRNVLEDTDTPGPALPVDPPWDPPTDIRLFSNRLYDRAGPLDTWQCADLLTPEPFSFEPEGSSASDADSATGPQYNKGAWQLFASIGPPLDGCLEAPGETINLGEAWTRVLIPTGWLIGAYRHRVTSDLDEGTTYVLTDPDALWTPQHDYSYGDMEIRRLEHRTSQTKTAFPITITADGEKKWYHQTQLDYASGFGPRGRDLRRLVGQEFTDLTFPDGGYAMYRTTTRESRISRTRLERTWYGSYRRVPVYDVDSQVPVIFWEYLDRGQFHVYPYW
jgi:hypothetical protein